MNNIMLMLTIVALTFTSATAQTNSKEISEQSNAITVTLEVAGMSCVMCSKRIDSELSKREGIIEKEVNFRYNKAIVTYDPEKISAKEIIAAIEKAGFKAKVMKDDEKK